ncbi:MAG: hypothetical protein JNM91_08035 [Flavobacteriales bacterium]|nr:hypothetical protein [Flavobacteriales bacterium]
MRTAFTFFLCFPSFTLSAQSPYRPFPESNAGWLEVHSRISGNYLECSDFDIVSCTTAIRTASDTLIQGVTYHTLIARSGCSITPVLPGEQFGCGGYYTEPWADLYFYRQDVQTRKVWMFDTTLQAEALLFDFDLVVGPYPATVLSAEGALQVVSADSIALNDGWHRTWGLAYTLDGEPFCSIIEGIGSSFGVRPQTGLSIQFEGSDELLCHEVADDAVLPLGQSTCVTNVGLTNARTGSLDIHPFPNPASTLFHVRGPLPPGASFEALLPTGQLVAKGGLVPSTIDCSAWPPGVMIVRVLDAKDVPVKLLRVIKQ